MSLIMESYTGLRGYYKSTMYIHTQIQIDFTISKTKQYKNNLFMFTSY